MPSSHAVSLSYLSCYAAAALASHTAGPAGPVAAAAALAAGAFLASLRVRLGFHTAPQVLAGWALGCAWALGVHAAAGAILLPTLAAGSPALRGLLFGCTAAAVAAFAAAGAASWAADARALLRAKEP